MEIISNIYVVFGGNKMNREDIAEIREYALSVLNTPGSYSKEVKIMEKVLVMTTECLE